MFFEVLKNFWLSFEKSEVCPLLNIQISYRLDSRSPTDESASRRMVYRDRFGEAAQDW